ncbi:MAG: aminotransferase class V-fold PLP-dependent enzyme, partial [Acidobacteria bacterium]
MLTERELNDIRARFRVFQQRIYLNSCSQGALADVVEAGVTAYLTSWREQGSPWDMWTEQYEQARQQFAAFIGAHPDEVAIVSSVSAGINAVASALDFRSRSKVVMGEFEFPTMGHIWLAQQRRGARVDFIAAREGRIPVEAYAQAVDETTRLVPIAHVSFLNGVRADVRAIARLAHERGAWVMMDDYQDCGTRPIDVKALDVDFYLTGTLKYLLGPPGLAFLYVRRELIPSLQPTISGWFAQRDPFAFDVRRFDPSPTARRFQAGTPPIPNIYAAMPALDLL